MRNLRLKVTQNHRIRVKGLTHIRDQCKTWAPFPGCWTDLLHCSSALWSKQQVRRVHRQRCSSELVACTEAHQRFEGHFFLGNLLPMCLSPPHLHMGIFSLEANSMSRNVSPSSSLGNTDFSFSYIPCSIITQYWTVHFQIHHSPVSLTSSTTQVQEDITLLSNSSGLLSALSSPLSLLYSSAQP